MPLRSQCPGNHVHRHLLKGTDYFNATLLGGVALLCFYFHESLFGLLALALGLFLGLWRHELAIDTARQRYRFANYLLGFSLSSWHPLPAAERVMVRYYSKLTGHQTDGGAVEYGPEGSYLVLLSVPGQAQALLLLDTPNYSKALRLGCFLGNVLGLPVFGYDRTKQEELLQEVD